MRCLPDAFHVFWVRRPVFFAVWLVVYAIVLHFALPLSAVSPLSSTDVAFRVWPELSTLAAMTLPACLTSQVALLERVALRNVVLLRALATGCYVTALIVVSALMALPDPGIMPAIVRNACIGIALATVASLLAPSSIAWFPTVVYGIGVFLLSRTSSMEIPWWAAPVLTPAGTLAAVLMVIVAAAAVAALAVFGTYDERRQT